jgi:hypothetical protein
MVRALMPRSIPLCMIAVGVAWLFCGIASGGEQAFLSPREILDLWESTYGSLKSIRTVYSVRMVEKDIPADRADAYAKYVRYTRVERTESGVCYHHRYTTSEKGFAAGAPIFEHAFNGSVSRDYWSTRWQGRIFSGLVGRPVETDNDPAMYMLLDPAGSSDRTPRFKRILADEKGRADITVRPNLETVAGEMCHVVEVAERGTGRRTEIWVAHTKGAIPLRYRSYRSDKMVAEIEVAELGAYKSASGEVWFPAKAFRTVNSEARGINITYALLTETFETDIETSAETFEFAFPPGTAVNDHTISLEYVTGDGMSEPLDKNPPNPPNAGSRSEDDASNAIMNAKIQADSGDQPAGTGTRNPDGTRHSPLPIGSGGRKVSSSLKLLAAVGIAGLGLLLIMRIAKTSHRRSE